MAGRSEVLAGGARCIVLDGIGSTNAEALRLSRASENGPLWIMAREQTAGRGRRGRTWTSPPGNLYATLLLTDPCRPERAAQLSFVAAVALHDALSGVVSRRSGTLQVKWPNDLLLDGAKIAGILVEGESAPGRPFAAAVGLGVNCVSHPAATAYPATDLRAAGINVSPENLLPVLAYAMKNRLEQWARGDGFESIRTDWTARAARLHESIRLRATDEEVEGRFEGIDGEGRLVLAMKSGERMCFNAGDVTSALADIDRLREGAAL